MFKKLPSIPSKDELLKILMNKYKVVESKSPKAEPGIQKLRRLEIKRVREVCNYLMIIFKDIAYGMPFLRELHPFYKELIDVSMNSITYKHSLAKISKARIAVKAILRDVVMMLRIAGSRSDVIKAKRMFIARIHDLVNNLGEELNYLRDAVSKIRKLPQIDPNIFTIVVAGMPNVGKSSFVKCVSTAEPEIAEYPFTTRQIHVGHIKLHGNSKIQLIDTPGILDRPLSERSKIELQAILALKYLANTIIFILDPTMHSGYEIERQLKLLKELRENFTQVPIIVLVNKIDIAYRESISNVEKMLKGFSELSAHKASTLRCEGVKELIDYVINTFTVPKIIEEVRKSRT